MRGLPPQSCCRLPKHGTLIPGSRALFRKCQIVFAPARRWKRSDSCSRYAQIRSFVFRSVALDCVLVVATGSETCLPTARDTRGNAASICAPTANRAASCEHTPAGSTLDALSLLHTTVFVRKSTRSRCASPFPRSQRFFGLPPSFE